MVGHATVADNVFPLSEVTERMGHVATINAMETPTDLFKQRGDFVQKTLNTSHIEDPEIRKRLLELALNYRDVFSMSEYDIGKCRIELT